MSYIDIAYCALVAIPIIIAGCFGFLCWDARREMNDWKRSHRTEREALDELRGRLRESTLKLTKLRQALEVIGYKPDDTVRDAFARIGYTNWGSTR